MEAKDLMIGDLFFIKDLQSTKAVGRVNVIGAPVFGGKTRFITLDCAGSFNNGFGYERTLEELLPIPLTEEILLTSGFKKEKGAIEDVFTFDDEDESTRLVIHPKETNYTHGAYTYIHIDRGCISIEELPIEYVHELQHALRLCGLGEIVSIEMGN